MEGCATSPVGLSRQEIPAHSADMSTVATKPKATRPVRSRKRRPAWMGFAKGKIIVRPNVDLTKPTAPDGSL